MRSALPKVLHRAAGLPLIEWVVRLARSVEPRSITLVLGHGGAEVRSAGSRAPATCGSWTQEPQLGTGHALLQARPALEGRSGRVLLLSGDVPLLTRPSVARLLDKQGPCRPRSSWPRRGWPTRPGTAGSFGKTARLVRIVEHRDASAGRTRHRRDQQRRLRLRARVALRPALAARVGKRPRRVLPAGPGGHLPARRPDGRRRDRADADEIQGINTRIELAEVGRQLQHRTNQA